MKKFITIFIFTFFVNVSFAQDYSAKNSLRYFSMSSGSQFVELVENKDSVFGRIIHSALITHNKKSKKNYYEYDTVSIPKPIATSVLDKIWNEKYINLKSQEELENWENWMDASYYGIKFYSKNRWYKKKYVGPRYQEDIPEAKAVLSIFSILSEGLSLAKEKDDFFDGIKLKSNYCYSRGSIGLCAAVIKRIGLGYFGTSRIPTGYQLNYWVPPIFKKYTLLFLELDHLIGQKKVTFSRNYDFNFTVGKWGLFTRNPNEINDELQLNFRRRFFDFLNSNTLYTNYKVLYRFPIGKNTSLGAGTDYLLHNSNDFGVIVYAGHDFFKEQLWIDAQTSIFKEEVDYKIAAHYILNIKKVLRKKRRIHLNTGVENFRNYTDVFFGFHYNL